MAYRQPAWGLSPETCSDDPWGLQAPQGPSDSQLWETLCQHHPRKAHL